MAEWITSTIQLLLVLGQTQLRLQATKHTNYVLLEKKTIDLKINGFLNI